MRCCYIPLIIAAIAVSASILGVQPPPDNFQDLSLKHNNEIIDIPCWKVDHLPSSWCLDDDSNPHYYGDGDSEEDSLVRRYTHEGFEKCLASKTIVIIGDSRARYQFTHLASYMRNKKFMKCQDASPTGIADEECLVINEKTDGFGWNAWYTNTTRMLEGENQTSLCDCARPPVMATDHIFEGRYIKRSTSHGEINMIYLQNFLDKISVNQDFPPYSPHLPGPEQRCKPGYCGRWGKGGSTAVNAFVGNLNATLWTILPKLNTTHAFVNKGWDLDFNSQSAFSCTIEQFSKAHPSIKLSYLSHPPRTKNLGNPLATYNAANLQCKNISVFDRHTMTKNVPTSWYWSDGLHVFSILNEEFNHQLVKQICPM